MKKSSFLSVICLCAGIIGALLACAAMFVFLHWPGGASMLLVSLLALLCLNCFAIPGLKRGALHELAQNGDSNARHLRNILAAMLIAICVICIGGIFKLMCWPGASMILLVGFAALAILLLLAGIFACRLYKE